MSNNDKNGKKGLKLKTMRKSERGKSNKKPEREVDSKLLKLIDDVNSLTHSNIGKFAPQCTNRKCGSFNVKEYGTRTGILCGTKSIYKCKDCKVVFVSNDDRYRNVMLKFKSLEKIHFGGNPREAAEMLRQYGVNPQNMDLYHYLVDSSKIKVSNRS